MPDPSTERFESAPGVEVVVTVHPGASAGPPVLLLHGLGQQRSFWDPVVRRLRARPVATMDQRGHGDTGTPLDRDYSVSACAADVITVLDRLRWVSAVVVGHSWGASVALEAAARAGGRVAAVVLVDGGLWSPSALGPREEVRRALTPPALGVPADRLWALMRDGELGPWWSDEMQQALSPTFRTDDDGLVRTRLGVERHMKVLDGLLDHDQSDALDACEANRVPVWAAVCEPSSGELLRAGVPGAELPRAWQAAKAEGMAAASRRANCLVHRWPGAVHDVPLQWPALVAGLVDAVVEQAEGGDR